MDVVKQELSRGVRPEELGVVSFTRRAAQEALERVAGQEAGRFPHIRTLHSTCYRALGINSGQVLAGRHMREFADWAGVDITIKYNRDAEEGMHGTRVGDRILHLDNLARVSDRPLREVYDEAEHELLWTEVKRVSDALAHYKQQKGLMDYTDMLRRVVDGGRILPTLRTVLVDEGQDLSRLQWGVVEALAERAERFVVAGDDDQAIYAWAGAAVDHFVEMPGEVRLLDKSWRVPRRVQELAVGVMSRVQHRRPKHWHSRDEEGEVRVAGSVEEVDFSGKDVLVLSRNHTFLQELVVPVLRREGVFYEYRGGYSMDPQILSAIMGWERLRRGDEIPIELARATLFYVLPRLRGEGPPKGAVGDIGMAALRRAGLRAEGVWHEALGRLPPEELAYILAMRRSGERLREAPRVRLSTIHGAKGAQADHVVLLLDVARRTHLEAEKYPDDEARVWYVGVTRARSRLTLVDRPGALRNFSL